MPDFNQVVELWFKQPILPSSVLVSVLAVYWVIVAFGALDLDFLDFDLDMDLDVNVFAIGLVPLKFLNLGRVPVMIWFTFYALSAWLLTMVIHMSWAPDQSDGVKIAEAFGLALLAAKLTTHPLRNVFASEEANRPETLIGRTCVIRTTRATATSGEADLATDAAPLTLFVRTIDEELEKGQRAEIVQSHKEDNTYSVRGTSEEVQ